MENCRKPQGDKEPMKQQWKTTPSSEGSLGNYRLVKIVKRKCQSKTKGPGGEENGSYTRMVASVRGQEIS